MKPFWEDEYLNKEKSTFGNPSKEVKELVPYLKKDAKILDVGCGDGRHALYLASLGFQVDAFDLSKNAIEKIEKSSRTKGSVTGIPTGFVDLDYQMSGFQPSDLILVAARPSMGKTAFVLNIAQYMAFRKDVTVAIFSLEMSKEQLVNRLLSLESKVDSQNIRTGNLEDEEWAKLIEGANIIGSSNMIIDDTPGISISELRSKCRKYKLEHNLGIIFIDYLQLMTGSGKRAGNFRYFPFIKSISEGAECAGSCTVSA